MKLDELFLTEAPRWPKTKEEALTRLKTNGHIITGVKVYVNDDLTVDTNFAVLTAKTVYKNDMAGRPRPVDRLAPYSAKYFPVKFRDVATFRIEGPSSLITLEGMPKKVEELEIKYANFLTTLDYLPDTIENKITISNCKRLTALGKFPKEIKGNLELYRCPALLSIEGLPKHVGGNVDIHDIPAIQQGGGNFRGLPTHIDGDLEMDDSKITSLVGLHEHVKYLGGDFYFEWDSLQRGGISVLLIEGIKFQSQLQYYQKALKPSTDNRPYKALEIIKKYVGKPDEIFDCQAELVEAGLEEFAEL